MPATSIWDIDVGAISAPDAIAVDALARLQLAAKRFGYSLRLVHACDELRGFIDLMGLADVLPSAGELSLETGRETEQGKETLGVEEERDPGDLPA